MKKTLMILSFFAVISCAGVPKNGDGGQIAPEAPDRVHSSTAQAVREEADPLPVSETSVVQAEPLPVVIEPSPAEAVTEQTEPAIEAPEADTAVQPPQETLNLAALPEPPPLALAVPSEPAPDPPPLPPPPEPSRLAQTPPEPRPAPPPARPAPVPRPAPPPAPVIPAPQPRPVEPPPPPVSQPVEESLPVIAREPVPVPPPPPPPIPEPPDEIIPLPEAQGEEIIFSRIVRAIVGQLVEVPFRGTGWVFLGEQAARRGIVYDSRRLDPEGQSFVFRTEDAGAYTLKFFKQDFIRDFIFNDYVQVIVGNAPETAGTGWFNSSFDRGRVRAEPRWPNSLEEAQALRRGRGPESGSAAGASSSTASPEAETLPDSPGTAASPEIAVVPASTPETAALPASGPPSSRPPVPPAADEGVVPVRPPALGTGNSTTAPPQASADAPVMASETPVNAAPETFLEKAREEFDAGRITQAISQLDMFHNRYPSGSDEAWWLYGQFYEANSPSRNILAALDYYRRLVREYPQSSRYNDARRRIAYLERYYINIQ